MWAWYILAKMALVVSNPNEMEGMSVVKVIRNAKSAENTDKEAILDICVWLPMEQFAWTVLSLWSKKSGTYLICMQENERMYKSAV